MFKILGALLFGILALASTVITCLLFALGSANNWTSDGPAMLMVYLGILLFGGATLGFGWVTFAILTGETGRLER